MLDSNIKILKGNAKTGNDFSTGLSIYSTVLYFRI